MAADPDEDVVDHLPFAEDLWRPGTDDAAEDSPPQAGDATAGEGTAGQFGAGAATAGAATASAGTAGAATTDVASVAPGPIVPGLGAPARSSPGQPVSVWQQSAAAWQEAGIDWLRVGRAGAATAAMGEDDDPHTEPIPALAADGSPRASRTARSPGRPRAQGPHGADRRAGEPSAVDRPPGTSTTVGTRADATTKVAGPGRTGDAVGTTAAGPGKGKTAGTDTAPGGIRPDGRGKATPGKAGQADPGKAGRADPGKAGRPDRRNGAPLGHPGTRGTRRRRRLTVVSVTALVLVAGTLAGIGIARSGRGGPAGPQFALVSPYPPAVAADASLAGRTTGTTPLLASLAGIAAAGQTVVAIGAAPSQPASVPLFLVSTDGGRTWARATMASAAPVAGAGAAAGPGLAPGTGVAAGPGAAAAPGAITGPLTTPVLIARGGGTWLALGQHAAWTSPDAKAWQQAPGPPLVAGDTVLGLAGTGTGFVAVGEHGGRQPGPVVWTSSAGRAWQRSSGAALGLTVHGGHLAGLRWAAAEGQVVLVGGQITAAARQGRRAAAGLWRSTDGGRTWSQATLPGSHGATGGLTGLAATGSAFLAVRSGRAEGRQDAVTFLSAQGSAWHYAGKLTPVRRASLQVTTVSGNSNGFAVAAAVRSSQVAFAAAPGHGWQQTAYPGPGLTGLTSGPGGTVLVAGNSQPGAAAGGARPHLLLITPRGGHRQAGGAALAAAATPDVTVNGLAAEGGTLVAAGGSGGSPALWRLATAGQWAPAAVLLPGAWRAGALASVAHGGDGWLAVGNAGGSSAFTPPAGAAAGPAAAGVPAAAGAPAAAVIPAAATRPSQPVILTSATGTSWAPASGAGAPTAAGISLIQAVAGPSGYVVVGSAPVARGTVGSATGGSVTGGSAPGGSAPAAWYSADLSTWARVSLPGPGTGSAAGAGTGAEAGAGAGAGAAAAAGRQVLAVTAARSGFVAVGSAAGTPAVWTSRGGQAWAFTALPRPAGAAGAVLAKVTAAGRRVVAVGYESRAGSAPGGTPFAAVSADGGRTWQESALAAPSGSPRPAMVTALTAAGHGFVALGLAGRPGRQAMLAWWSADGLTWSHAAVAGGGWNGALVPRINAVMARDGTLTGAGFAASTVAEHPVFWHARYR